MSLDPADSDIGTLLGWPNGRIPGAEVRVERENVDGGIDDPIVQTTNAEGRATFSGIFAGIHRVSAIKVLTPGELAIVAQTRPLLRALAGGDKSVGEQDATFPVTLRANRTDGFVLSEVSTVDSAGGDGIWFGYLEVYNNSLDVRYLDGMLLGRTVALQYETAQRSCTEAAVRSNDPAGIWARFIQRFPGSGTQYPVQPGEAVVLAFDAIDHSQNRSWQLDLSDADFEFRTDSDADNPSVPDLRDVGPRKALQSGIQFISGWHPAWLARSVEPTGLPEARVLAPGSDDTFVRLPTADIADVLDPITGEPGAPFTICPRSMHPNFSALPYVWKRRPNAHRMSQQRRPIGIAPGGWTILLDTNTSSVDWFEETRTPGDVP